jgi:hypothetical protein
MSDIANAAMATSTQMVREQIAISVLKADAEAQRQLAEILVENAERIQAASARVSALGGIDVFV